MHVSVSLDTSNLSLDASYLKQLQDIQDGTLVINAHRGVPNGVKVNVAPVATHM